MLSKNCSQWPASEHAKKLRVNPEEVWDLNESMEVCRKYLPPIEWVTALTGKLAAPCISKLVAIATDCLPTFPSTSNLCGIYYTQYNVALIKRHLDLLVDTASVKSFQDAGTPRKQLLLGSAMLQVINNNL